MERTRYLVCVYVCVCVCVLNSCRYFLLFFLLVCLISAASQRKLLWKELAISCVCVCGVVCVCVVCVCVCGVVCGVCAAFQTKTV